VVESIYISALAEKNTEQIIKSTAYRIKYITHLEEEGYILAIEQLENDLQNMPNEAKYFSHALLAEMYSSYLKDNYYQISQRTRLMDFVPDDKETWDENLFKAKIIEHYKLALNEELKNMPVEKYPELISYDKLALEFKLTVYDLFSEMAFTKFTETYSSFWYYRLAQHAGFPANPKFCANANEFLKINYEQTDTTDFNYHAYVVMRNWVDYRLSEPNEVSALVYTDLMRLNYYRENTENSKFDAEWLKSLEELRSKYKNTKALIDINYSLGKYYIAQGSNYSFNQANTEVYADYNRKAWNLFDEVVTNIKDTAIIGKCLNAKASIESKELSFLSKDINLVKKPIQVQIQYKNIEKLNISILQIDYQDYKTIESRYYSGEQLVNALQKKSKLINTIKLDLGGETDFNKHAADYFLQELPMGFYVLIAHTDEDFAEKDQVSAYTTTTVSNLAYTSSNNADGTWQILVADAITGVPIKNVEIILYKTVYNYSKSKYERKVLSILKTDNTGLAIYSSDKDDYSNFYVEIKTKNEIIPIQESAYLYQVYSANKNYEKVHFFTDRAIYRPGQTIHFKGINIKVENSMPKLLKTQKLSIGLYDANNQKLTSVSVQANMFGSFSGSFDIPHGALNGYYTIKCPYGNKGISVEEYKRPKFETSFKAIEDEYRIGDEVNIKGNVNTYAGSQISGAKVSYTVSRIVSWRGWPYFYIDIPKKQITHGECVSNEKGEFEIKFKTEFDGEIPNQGNAVFQYEIDIVVTDINGETQVNSTIVSASKNALFLTDNFPNILNSEQFDTLQVIAYNNNYKEIDANVIVEIYEVIDPKTLLSKNLFGKTDRKFYTQEEWYNQKTDIEYDDETNIESWEIGKKVFESSLNTGESTKLSIGKEIQKLNSGLYRLKLKTTDKFGTKVEHINQFALYSSNSKTMPYTTPAMFFQEKFRVLPGENAVLYVGSSFKNVKYLIEIERNGKLIKREWKSLSNELQKIEIPVSEEDRGSFKVNFIFIKNAGIYNKQFTVYVPWNNKNLHLKLETFRNKIEPGSNEEWKLKLVDNDGNPAYAEVLAGMYDASLDVFAANNWSLSLYPDFFFHKYWTTSFLKIKTGKSIFRFSQKYFTEKAHYMNLRTFGALNPNSYSYFVERGQYKAEILLEAEEAPDMTDSEPTGAAGMLTDRKSSTSVMSLHDEVVDKEEVNAIDIRTNFNETAFFYPHLITDKNGEVSINFKAPESLTRWNLMALAHTEDLK
ncbi:MAG: hypothetical protein GX879_04920, partial [Bacteroidales bacterium]|nr:hypothetical protein [Bacteroidales bacterium]